MKVIIIGSDELRHNGRIAKIRVRLRSRGYDVLTLRLRLDGETAHDPGADMQAHTQRKPLPSNGLLKLWASKQRFNYVMRNSAKILTKQMPLSVHVMDPYALKAASVWKQQSRARTQILFDACEWFEGTAAADAPTAKYIRRTLQQHGQSINFWFAPSEAVAQLYTSEYSTWPRHNLLSNAPDWRGDPPDRLTSPLRKALKIRPSERIMLYSGGFNSHRGLIELVKGADTLPPNWHLVLMGYGPLEATLKQIASIVKPARTHFIEAVPQAMLRSWIAGADTGLIPYAPGIPNHEVATPNKLYEYPAAGVPIISGDLSALNSILRKNKIGVTVPHLIFGHGRDAQVANVASLVETSQRLIQQSDLPKRLQEFTERSTSSLFSGLDDAYPVN